MLRASVKSLVPPPLRYAIRQLATEFEIARLHRASSKEARRAYADAGPLSLNLASGHHPKSGWVNVDLFHQTADLRLDLRRPLPFRDNSARYIYVEHFFEHLEYLRRRDVPESEVDWWGPAWCDNRMHRLNYLFRQGREHKYAYDEDTLSQVLRKAQFEDVRRRAFNPAMDAPNHIIGSLCMTARKQPNERTMELSAVS